MCTFITSWLQGPVDRTKLKAVLKENGFDLTEYPASPIKQKVGAAIYFRPTQTHCDCGTVFGRSHQKKASEDSLEAQIHRLKKKGWGEAKIGKWLEARERTKKKTARETPRSETATAQMWLSLINQLLRAHRFKSIGILFHHYHGDQSIEDFQIGEKIGLNLGNLNEGALAELNPETPYEISDAPNWNQ